MTLTTLPETDNVHRPHPGATDEYTETDEQGHTWIVPPRLYCRAPITVLRDEFLTWVSPQEATRLKDALDTAYKVAWEEWGEGEREHSMDVADVLEFMAREGYAKIGGYLTSAEEGVEEQHYLFRSEGGEHVFITPVLWDEGSLYLHHVDTSNQDVEGDNRLLYLESDEDKQLADRNQLLCRDGKGYHVQVALWRSTKCQCADDSGVLVEERLRALWLAKVS